MLGKETHSYYYIVLKDQLSLYISVTQILKMIGNC